CKLCLEDKPLCASHIIPEFLHRDLYDSKHRAREIRVGRETATYLQKGYREKLLCLGCEQLLNDRYEKPFCQEWRPGTLIPTKPLPDPVYGGAGLDYAAIKLCLLSILFRCSVSTLSQFSVVTLGPHQDKLRRMILDGNPGPPGRYKVVGFFAVDRTGTVLPCV